MLTKLLKVPQNSQQNNSEAVTNENDKEQPKERYIYISRRKRKNHWWPEIKIIV